MTTEQGKEITPLGLTAQAPAEVVKRATEAARELTKVVKAGKLALQIGDREYLRFEAWQTLGAFWGITPRVTYCKSLEDEEGNIYGFEAEAEALQRGQVLSAANAECTRGEENWVKKPRFQLRSMAQTRACAKALRQCLAWIVALGGYEPTPAEEMVPEKEKARPERGNPWAYFRQETRLLGYSVDKVCQILKVPNLRAWLQAGGTPQEALHKVRDYYQAEKEGQLKAEQGKLLDK